MKSLFRNKFGLNFQTFNYGGVFDILPLAYVEVSPGDTIEGQIEARCISDNFTNIVLNKAYFDCYAFYIPYRLLWDSWVDFIQQDPDDTAITLPVVTDTFRNNFEGHLTLTTATENVAFMRYAYNYIWNTFFKRFDQAERTTTANSVAQCSMRETMLERCMRDTDDVTVHTVDVSGGTLSAEQIRQVLSEDRYQRLKDYYGNRYVDFLAMQGVKADWAVLEEPEVIGKNQVEWKYQAIRGNSDSVFSGLFDGTNTLRVRRTFCPEHGLIMAIAVAKVDYPTRQAQPLLLSKTHQKHFFNPEYDTGELVDLPAKWINGSSTAVLKMVTFDDYRLPMHMEPYYTGTDGPSARYWMQNDPAGYTSDNLRDVPNIDGVAEWGGTMGNSVRLQIGANCSLTRVSALRNVMASGVR